MESIDPTIMRDDTLGEEHNYQRLTQILRPRSAPADGKVMSMTLQGGPHPPVIPITKQRNWDDEYDYSDERFDARHIPPGDTARDPFRHSGGLLDPGAAHHRYVRGTHRSHATGSHGTPNIHIYDNIDQDMHPRSEARALQRTPSAFPRGRPILLDNKWALEDEEPFRIQPRSAPPAAASPSPDYRAVQLALSEERAHKMEARQQRDPSKELLLKDTEGEDRRIRERYERERREDPRRRQEEEEIEELKKRTIQVEEERAAQEYRLKVEKKAKEAEERKRIIAEFEKKRALRENKAQCHIGMQLTASQQSIGGYRGPDSKQPGLDVFRSRPMSKERQLKTAYTMSAQAEASGSKFLHHRQNQENSTLAPDQTNLSTQISTIEVGCADPEEVEETGQDHDSDVMLDNTSTGVFDTMNDECRRNAQLHLARAEHSGLDSRTTFHTSKRRRIDRSHSPASLAEFSCETCHQAQFQLQELRFKVSILEAKNQQLEQEKSDAIKWAKATVEPYFRQKWVTIYEVSEDRSTRWYEDQPQWLQKQDRQIYLAGKKPIFNLKAFLRQLQLGNVPFIVVQEFTKLRHPDVLTQDIQNWPLPTSSNVSMQIISNHLSKTFEALLDEHNELKEHADFQKTLHDDDDCHSEVDSWRNLDEDDSDAKRINWRLVNIDLLYFHFQDLFEEGLNSRTEGHHSETGLLLKFLRTGFQRKQIHAKELLAQSKISKDTITYLFKPGAVIVSQATPRIRGLKQTRLLHTSSSEWRLSCQSWTFDGKFHQERDILRLPGKDLKDGPVNITSLPFYPLQYAQPEIDQKLLQRGKTFWTFRKPVYVTYTGLDMRGDTAYDQARFLIDPITWKRYRQAELALKKDIPMIDTIAQGNELDESLMLQSDLPSAEFPYLVPEKITGFNMQDKKWVDLQVDNISKVKWDKRSFDNLAIAEENKKIIKALVLNKIESDKATDVVPGKGNGLVILLHGGPGTGKTLTAESVADLAEKPLYRVTCGDIGTEPRKVEEYLENVFFLGKIWDCVVLLDEADVFLEQRSLSDLARNALVSVFLRTLEYYDGILILTSNRVGTFDEAFKSRIQLALHYDSLNGEQRKHIWYTFIKRLEELDEPIEAMEIYTNMETLSMEEMNGRQIRNAITTARQLALFEGKKLNLRHLQESIKVSGQFDEYLHELHGPDDRRMQDEGIRLAPKSDSK